MSFVAILTTDTGNVEHPIWGGNVAKAIGVLDEESLTLVMLAPAGPKGLPEGEHHMAIGGGKDGRCVVYITEDNPHFWNCEDTGKSRTGKRFDACRRPRGRSP